MILKLVPGIIMGQWAAVMVTLASGIDMVQSESLSWLLAIGVVILFVVLCARGYSVRAAWGRSFLGMALIFYLMPFVTMLIDTGIEDAPREAEIIAAVGPSLSTIVWLFLGTLMLLPAVSLLLRAHRERIQKEIEQT